MSLARRQINAALERILQEELQKGIIPTVDSIIASLNEVFKGRSPGMPTLKYRPAPYRGRSSPADWNSTVDELHTDLTLLYEENVDQITRILMDFDYAEVERRKLERHIAELEDRIEELLLLNSNVDGYLYSVYDDFRTLSKVDLEHTTAWVDLSLCEVSPPHAKVGNVKADLTRADTSVEVLSTSGVIDAVELESLSNILDDNINTSWLYKVITSTSMEVKVRVRLLFDQVPATRIQVQPHVASKTRIEIAITEDQTNYKNVLSTLAQEKVACDFSELELQGIDIVLSKGDHDETISSEDGSVGYVYYFGIVNVSVLKMGFEDAGVLQSTSLSILDRQGREVPIDKISIDVVEEVPMGSRINYYIALDEETLEWQPITPIGRDDPVIPKVIDLKSLSSTNPVTGLNASSAAPIGPAVNGLVFYRLSSTEPGNANYIDPSRLILKNNDSLKLYKGIGQFRREKYTFEWDSSHEPTLADWLVLPSSPDGTIKITPDDVDTAYADVSQKITFNEEFTSYRLVTCAYFASEPDPVNGYLQLRGISGADPQLNVRVFLNGVQLNQDYIITPSKMVRFQWPFVRGWNIVMLLVYKPNAAVVELDLGFSLLSVANKVRVEQEPMTYVSYFDLLYNIPEKDIDKYSLADDNSLVISEYQKRQGAKYEFYYKYYVDTSRPHALRVKAELFRGEDAAVAPKLKYYRVRVS